MLLKEQIKDFAKKIETFLQGGDASLSFETAIYQARHLNRWHTKENVITRLQEIASFLRNDFSKIDLGAGNPSIIGISCDENIPLEEFHTLIYTLSSGHTIKYKDSKTADPVLKKLIEWMQEEIPTLKDKILFTPNLKSCDRLYISSREEKPDLEKLYFERHNVLFEAHHQSAAILDGEEDEEYLHFIASQIFSYYSQSRLNIKKIFIPENYDIRRLFEFMQKYVAVIDHHPYANNYQYHQSVYLMNRIEHYDNGFLLVRKDIADRAPTGVLYYETYNNSDSLMETVSKKNFFHIYSQKNLGFEPKNSFYVSQAFLDFLK